LIGKDDEVVEFFEFENVFGLAETLDQVQFACQDMVGRSFHKAKEELYELYSVMDLYRM